MLSIYLIFISLIIALFGSILFFRKVKSLADPKAIKFKHLPQTLYTNKLRYVQGEVISCYANTNVESTINIYQLKEEKVLIRSFGNLPVNIQENSYHPKYGCNWRKTIDIDTENLEAGLYIIGVKGNAQEKECFFHAVVIVPTHQKNDIAVFASTNTWLAYNYYGGQSNYLDDNNHLIFKVPYKMMGKPVPCFLPTKRPHLQNPNDVANGHYNYEDVYESLEFAHHPRREWPLLASLYKNKVGFDTYSDWDMAYNPEVLQYDKWIINNHSEYWSAEMKGMLKKYIEGGGKVIIASGNTMYRDVEFYNDGIKMSSQLSDIEITSKLSGTFFTEDGYLTLSSFKIVKDKHFAFNGIDSKEFGHKSLYSYNGQTGASGIETDKINYYSDGFEIIAVGTNESGPAHMTYKETDKGWIFNASSIAFANSILVDKNCERLFLNLINN